jgi:hypothetical protein
MLTLGDRHLRGVLAEYVRQLQRPSSHRAPPLQEPGHTVDFNARFERRQVLGGLASECRLAA